MRRFYDFESDCIYTESQIEAEYNKFKYAIELSSGATTFKEFLENALGKDGFLMEVK